MDSFDIPTEIMYFDWKKKQNEEKHKPTATPSTAGGGVGNGSVKVKISEKILTRVGNLFTFILISEHIFLFKLSLLFLIN